MGRSAKWRVSTPTGQRLVRVQVATKGRRVRLFVDETLLEQYDALEDLRDDIHTREFDLQGVACQLTIAGPRITLKANGVELESTDARST